MNDGSPWRSRNEALKFMRPSSHAQVHATAYAGQPDGGFSPEDWKSEKMKFRAIMTNNDII